MKVEAVEWEVPLKVVALAGGVGGAKLAAGLADVLENGQLTVVVNTGDDFVHFGLNISPDIDTVCYTLARLANPTTGWGREGDTFTAVENSALLGGPKWFNIGDRDLGTHLERTRRLAAGDPLSLITRDFCRAWGVRTTILPMTDQPVSTMVETVEHGWLAFQNYFVEYRCEPTVRAFQFKGIPSAEPAPGVLESIRAADLVVICPSNPWVSIDPILAVRGIRLAVEEKMVIAVSPIIGGKAVKGPAAKMFRELGIDPSPLAVAVHYRGLGKSIIVDHEDSLYMGPIRELGIVPFITNTLMLTPDDRRRLALETLKFGKDLVKEAV